MKIRIKFLSCIVITFTYISPTIKAIPTSVRGFLTRSQYYSGVYYSRSVYEKEIIPEYETSSFWRNYKAVDARNIRQQDYEYKFASDNNVSETDYKEYLYGQTCVVTAATVIVDYYIRKNGKYLDAYTIYQNVLWTSYNKGYFYKGVDPDNIGYVLYYALQNYKSYTGIDFNYIEKKTTNIYETVKEVVDNDDVALYIFGGYHATIASGYLNYDVTLESGSKQQVNTIVINDVSNNYFNSSFSSGWYYETDLSQPDVNKANYAFVPEKDLKSGQDYLWTIRSTL